MGLVDVLGTGMWTSDSGSLTVNSFVTHSCNDRVSSCIPSSANAVSPWNVHRVVPSIRLISKMPEKFPHVP